MARSFLVFTILSFLIVGPTSTKTAHLGEDAAPINQVKDVFDEENLMHYASTQSFSSITQQKNTPHEQISSLNQDERIPEDLRDKNHGVKMGVSSGDCDDARTKLLVDWDGNEADYTCYQPAKNWPLTDRNNCTEVCINSPEYMSNHFCMFSKIEYDEPIPYYGDHRPLWPKYGEFNYLPPQRWLHSLEHGAIAFFYHPCARTDIVMKIKSVLINCMRKYVIAKNTNLEPTAPFLLMAWGCKNFMSGFDEAEIVRFIRAHAMKAPESRTKGQGWYDWELLWESVDPPPGSDIYESHLCPSYPQVLTAYEGVSETLW